MVSSLLVLMNDKPCVLTCSMKVKRSILLIRAMDNMQYDEIEPTGWFLELDEHEGYFEDFLYLLSLRFLLWRTFYHLASTHTHAYRLPIEKSSTWVLFLIRFWTTFMFCTLTDFAVFIDKNLNLCFIWLFVFCVSGNQNDLF